MSGESASFNVDLICPVVKDLATRHAAGALRDSEFVAIYILLLLSTRKNKYLGGKYRYNSHDSASVVIDRECSVSLATIPGLVDGVNLLDGVYLTKKLNIELNDIRICDIFTNYTLNGIRKNQDNYVNRQIINWMIQEANISVIRKPSLLFHIPTPLQVLEMQCKGTRVVTLFKERHELTKKHVSYLHYMGGQAAVVNGHNNETIMEHEKDALEFLLHDLKHFDNFIGASFYEQVGFFNCLVDMHASSETKNKIKLFYLNELKYDKQLYLELEYVLSDMNCFLPHMLKYIQAKMRHAVARVESNKDTEGRFVEDWTLFITRILHYNACNDENTVKNQVLNVLVQFVSTKEKDIQVEEYELLRAYFTTVAFNKLHPPSE